MTLDTTDFHTPEAAKRDVASGAQNFSIRELCESFDVTPRALRFYESQGLISPERDGQRRIYSLRDRARLFLVLRGKRFGFSLAEIRDLLDLYKIGDRQRTQVEATLEAGRGKLQVLEERRRELDDAIDELKIIIGRLEATRDEMATGVAGAPTEKNEPERRPKKPLLGQLSEEARAKRGGSASPAE